MAEFADSTVHGCVS
ncbi:trans-sialidase, putative, partial [Trypanosoma cruzi marinkellei]